MKSSEHFNSHFRLSHYPVLLLFFLLSSYPASSLPKYSKWNDWLWMSPKRSIYIEIGCDPVIFTNNFIFTNYSLFTTHFIFYLFRTLHQVTYSTYLPLFHLFSFFQQSNDKTQVLLFPSKVLCFYVLDCIVHVSKSFEHPTHSKSTFPSKFLLSFPNTFPNLVQILHCLMYHKPRQFRPSLSPFFFFFFFPHSLSFCI